MAADDYETWTPEQLAELAYVLQIDYDPNNIDSDKIIQELRILKEKARLLEDETNRLNWENNVPGNPIGEWEKQIRQERFQSRSKTPCHQPFTVATNKDTGLMSNPQIAFMPSTLPNGDPIYYCLDRIEDVSAILKLGYNPFNREPLTQEQINYLNQILEDKRYPNIDTGNYFEEIEERLLNKNIEYKLKPYQQLAEELVHMVEHIGLKYEAEQILNFASELSQDQYNLFLKYRPIDKKIIGKVSRDEASVHTLNYILDYINSQGEGNRGTALVRIGKAIDEFMYMTHHNLDYQQLIEEKGVIEKGNVKELFWKPVFVVELLYSTGEIGERYYLNEFNNKEGVLTQYWKDGQIRSISFFNNNVLEGIARTYYPNGQLRSEILYVNGKDNGTYKQFYPTGQKRLEVAYENGIKNGPDRLFYINGQLAYEIMFDNGNPDKLISVWNQDGLFMGKMIGIKTSTEQYFTNDADQKIGPYIEFTGIGRFKCIGFYMNDKKENFWQKYHEVTNLVSEEGNYHNDLKEGTWKEYKREKGINGFETIEYSGLYSNGEKTGLWIGIHENGEIKSRGNYNNDLKNGLWTEQTIQFPSGILITHTGEYSNDKKIGKWVSTYDNGVIESEGNYVDGLKHGLWNTWDQNGQLQVMYEHGVNITALSQLEQDINELANLLI